MPASASACNKPSRYPTETAPPDRLIFTNVICPAALQSIRLRLLRIHQASFHYCSTSGRQDPHPVPAPVVSHRPCISVQPSLIFFSRLPSPTWLQLHTSRPITGSLMSPLRSSCNLFSLSSVLLAIRSLNSTNSFLSPISIAPTSRS